MKYHELPHVMLCVTSSRFKVMSCYPSPGVHSNPISLGDRWLAYADQRLSPMSRFELSRLDSWCASSECLALFNFRMPNRVTKGFGIVQNLKSAWANY